jgi:surfeit locus 1 family protein
VKRLPIVPTIIVLLAAATMMALGVWQLQRATWKEALIARYTANRNLPPMAYPPLGPVADDALFRKSRVTCLRVSAWRTEGGSTPSGQPGYRHIADCVTGAEGPGALIDMGVAADPKFVPTWKGGTVDGLITTEPNHASVISGMFGAKRVLRPMLVADVPGPDMAASAPPSVEGISNNHRAYAVQWFVFATLALVIYGLALRRRGFRFFEKSDKT